MNEMRSLSILRNDLCVSASAILFSVLAVSAAEMKTVDGIEAPAVRYVPVHQAARELMLTEPAYKTKKPLYISLELGDDIDSIISGAVDQSQEGASGYDLLYIDSDNDNDLTDEKPISMEKSAGNNAIKCMAPVTVRYLDGRERSINVNIMIYQVGSRWQYGWRVSQHLEGKVKLGGADDVLIGLYDTASQRKSSNGCFNDFGLDKLGVDANGDGKIDEKTETTLLSKIFGYNGKLWQIEISSSAGQIDVVPSSLAAGKLKLHLEYAKSGVISDGVIQLVESKGYIFTYDLSGAMGIMVPEGTYSCSMPQFSVNDSSGAVWNASFSLDKNASLVVKHDATAEYKFGSPVRIEPLISGNMKPGGRLTVQHKIVGTAGEQYQYIMKAGSQRVAPLVKITDASQKLLSEGKMGFG